jgi:hypothetical protein
MVEYDTSESSSLQTKQVYVDDKQNNSEQISKILPTWILGREDDRLHNSILKSESKYEQQYELDATKQYSQKSNMSVGLDLSNNLTEREASYQNLESNRGQQNLTSKNYIKFNIY